MNAFRESAVQDKLFGKLNDLILRLDAHDERGLVLSLAAFAEDALKRLLLAYLKAGADTEKLVDGFSAPLGTFSARIKASRAIGLISDEIARDLDRLRDIRNRFAHTWSDVSLSDQAIEIRIKAMRPGHSMEVGAGPRRHIITAVLDILVQIEIYISAATDNGVKLVRMAPNGEYY